MTDKQQARQRRAKQLKELIERQKKALELRLRGKNYREIATECGYAGPGNAYRAVQAALKATIQEPADEVRKMELDRLDQLFEKQWAWAIDNNQPQATDRVLRIMERRAKYLGLDAPTQIDLVGLRKRAEVIADKLGVRAVDVLGQAEEIAAATLAGSEL